MNKANDYPYLKHINDAIDKIKEFTEGVSFDDFSSNDMLQSAVIRKLEIIGEATKNISNETKNKYNEVPWRLMSDMRNFLIHQYFGVDSETIWGTIYDDLPKLKRQIDMIIKNFESL